MVIARLHATLPIGEDKDIETSITQSLSKMNSIVRALYYEKVDYKSVVRALEKIDDAQDYKVRKVGNGVMIHYLGRAILKEIIDEIP